MLANSTYYLFRFQQLQLEIPYTNQWVDIPSPWTYLLSIGSCFLYLFLITIVFSKDQIKIYKRICENALCSFIFIFTLCIRCCTPTYAANGTDNQLESLYLYPGSTLATRHLDHLYHLQTLGMVRHGDFNCQGTFVEKDWLSPHLSSCHNLSFISLRNESARRRKKWCSIQRFRSYVDVLPFRLSFTKDLSTADHSITDPATCFVDIYLAYYTRCLSTLSKFSSGELD